MKILKCWNGIYGCSSFIVENWHFNFKDINEAKEYYGQIWAKCWIEEEEEEEE